MKCSFWPEIEEFHYESCLRKFSRKNETEYFMLKEKETPFCVSIMKIGRGD